jgi:hypothetical protein
MLIVNAARAYSACSSMITSSVITVAHSAPVTSVCRLVPFSDTILRGIDTTGMATELFTTVALTSILLRSSREFRTTNGLRAAAHTYRIWPILFAALARIPLAHMSSSTYDTTALTQEFCALVVGTREWAFAHAGADVQGVMQSLKSTASAIARMDVLFTNQDSPYTQLLSVFRIWVQFELYSAETQINPNSQSLETFLTKISEQELSEYELHSVCWILDGVRGLMDEDAFVKVITSFNAVGLTAETFESKVASACMRISALGT